MRKLFLMLVLLGGYLWMITSGNDQFFASQGKALFEWVTHWLEGAEIDFQVKTVKIKRKERYWK